MMSYTMRVILGQDRPRQLGLDDAVTGKDIVDDYTHLDGAQRAEAMSSYFARLTRKAPYKAPYKAIAPNDC